MRWVAVAVVCGLVIAQFFGPAKTNPATDAIAVNRISSAGNAAVAAILDRSCNDCHSNKTRWPWYSNVAPVSWFVIDHVNEGRENLNFSEWGRYTQRDADSDAETDVPGSESGRDAAQQLHAAASRLKTVG